MANKYNEKIKNYYNTIEANHTYNYKNFKELCYAIGLNYVSSDSKKAILSVLNNYCLIEHTKNSHSYTIGKRDELSVAIANVEKKKRKRISEYAKTMYPIFLSLLKNRDTLVLQDYRNQLFISFGFTKNNLFQYHTTKKSDKMILDEFIQNCYGIIIQPFTRAITNLIKNGIIYYYERYMVIDVDNKSTEWRLATLEEQETIAKEIKDTLYMFNCKTMYEIFIKSKKNIFDENLNRFIQEKYPIEYKATCYELIFKNALQLEHMYDEYYNIFGKKTEKEINNEVAKLKKIINNRILTVVQKYNDREIQNFISQITEKKKEIFKQLKEDYGDEMPLEECTNKYKSLLEEFTNKIVKLD